MKKTIMLFLVLLWFVSFSSCSFFAKKVTFNQPKLLTTDSEGYVAFTEAIKSGRIVVTLFGLETYEEWIEANELIIRMIPIYSPTLYFSKVNLSQDLEAEKKYKISLTTIIFFWKDGTEYYRIEGKGTIAYEFLVKKIEEFYYSTDSNPPMKKIYKKETAKPTVEDPKMPGYGEWKTSKPSDYVYDYPVNKKEWVKDPYQELQSYFVKFSAIERVSRYDLDLNQDQIPELFLSWGGGTGGGNYVVYQKADGNYRFLGNLDFFPSPQVLPTMHHGFCDLMLFWRDGGNAKGEAEGTLCLYEFDGKKYQRKKEMIIILEDAIKKKIFQPNTDKIFSH